MSQAASQAHAFYDEVAETRRLWMLEDSDGDVPIAKAGEDEHEVTPVFSSERRAKKALGTLPDGYSAYEPAEVDLDDFREGIGKTLADEGVLLGVNWTGARATGYDREVGEVLSVIAACGSDGE